MTVEECADLTCGRCRACGEYDRYWDEVEREHRRVFPQPRTNNRIGIVLLVLAVAIVIGWLIAGTMDNRPSCPVSIVSPNRWEWTGTEPLTPQALAECVAPAYMVLHPDGSWSWTTES